MSTQEIKFDASAASEELANYLTETAERLQTRVEDITGNMEKKLEEIYQRLDKLERSLKEMEPNTIEAK
ncbi:uncharacterized protein B0P05DRAFT_554026 [Gilbertella persicaria]|uniref:uncharacterized protein n=1 Tax=Gilbertella persicaria TaxID=101096 RepID=UPI00221E9EE1|nr:uncharacterized protein B0P05DRAFT_554026 [Gilbertella persicaria]KAI8065360.1 hypothetical protein B0P05DRAFT_554026 [Gilbertella persicaria]